MTIVTHTNLEAVQLLERIETFDGETEYEDYLRIAIVLADGTVVVPEGI